MYLYVESIIACISFSASYTLFIIVMHIDVVFGGGIWLWCIFSAHQNSVEVLEEIHCLVKQVFEHTIPLDEALSSTAVSKLRLASTAWQESLIEHRTAKLWFMYMSLVAILRTFIRAGRTGNWALYLQALQQMLPYLAASGHHNYTKSIVLYLHKMKKLQDTHPHVYNQFINGFFVVRRTDSYWAGIYSDLFIEQVLMRNVKAVGGLTRGRGFEQSTSLIWLLSTPACAEVNKAMRELANLQETTDTAIHKDLSAARMTRDAKDLQTILHYFSERKPFSLDSKELRSLSSGLIGDKFVNADQAESAGQAIVESMVGKSVAEYKFCKKDQVTTLASSTYIAVEGERLEIDPKQLFQCLVVAGTSTINMQSLFSYELSSYPTALFDTSLLMRMPDKASLQNSLVKKVPSCVVDQCDDVVYVLDGGALLQKLPWPHHTTYAELSKLYVQYVNRHYSHAVVVFDGYASGPTTKDEAHCRRAKSKIIGAEVNFTPAMQLTMKKKTFLANPRNKQKFLNYIGSELEKAGVKVEHSSADADYNIVSTACTMAMRRSVTVVGEDTDLLVLLVHHLTPQHHAIFLQTATRIINIRTLQNHLDPDMTTSLLFLHAITGCDSVSRPYGIGKAMAMSKCSQLKDHAGTFLKPNQNRDEVSKHGQAALEVLYGCKHGNSLDFERASRFSNKVASRSVYLPPESLPPTTDAAKQHSLRVYHQVQAWLGNDLDPTKWGWQIHKGQDSEKLKPIRMQKDAAPESLLKLVKCNCHGKCDKNTCSCRKNGLLCTLACGHCKGISCTNAVSNEAESMDE